METKIQIFKNSQFGEVRVTEVNGELHFVAKDVAEQLGYTWNGSRIDHVPEEWKGMTSVVTPGGAQEVITLSEQGLYFFLARSDKPAAIPFQKWIAGEVLPAIRKTGGYIASKADDTPDEIMARALVIAQDTLNRHKQRVQMLEGERDLLERENKTLVPKAEYTDKVLQSTNTYTMTQVAKGLDMTSAIALEKKLNDAKVIFKQSGQWLLYAEYQGKGYTSSRTHYYEHDGETRTNTITVWTEKGRAFVHQLRKEGKV